MDAGNEAIIRLLDQDEFLIDPKTDQRKPVLEATTDECLAYLTMFFHQPEMIRVMYQQVVEENNAPLPDDPQAFVANAMEQASKLTALSDDYPSGLAYASHWLTRTPLIRVLMTRVANETPPGRIP